MIQCWHEHGHEQVTVDKYTQIPFVVNIIKVSMGSGISMFLAKYGGVWGCGYNATGALGLGHKSLRKRPTRIEWFMDRMIFMTDLEMGHFHTVGLDDKGCVYCWGDNLNGQSAVEGYKEHIAFPNKIEYELKDVKVMDIRVGGYHTGCITNNGDYYLWGSNGDNECCVEKDYVDEVCKPNNVNQYIFEKSECKQILDMVLGVHTTIFLLKN